MEGHFHDFSLQRVCVQGQMDIDRVQCRTTTVSYFDIPELMEFTGFVYHATFFRIRTIK